MNIRGVALVANGVFGSNTASETQRGTDRQIGDQRATGIKQPQKGGCAAITGFQVAKEGAKGLHRRTKGKEQTVQTAHIAQLVKVIVAAGRR
jgi:hypothetical protein